MANYTIEEVANYCIWYHNEQLQNLNNEKMTNLRLQKILYFTFGIYSAFKKEKLFEAKFEAWLYGPVIRKIYKKYELFGAKEIDLNLFLNREQINNIPKKINSKEDMNILNSIMDKYMSKNAFDLVDISHKENSPWSNVVKDKKYYAKINSEDIIKYFKDLYEKKT